MYILIIGALTLLVGLFFFVKYGFACDMREATKMMNGLIAMIAGAFLIAFGVVVVLYDMRVRFFCN